MLSRSLFGVMSAAALIGVLAWSNSGEIFARRSKSPLVCKKPVLAALQPMPKLSYPCDGELQDWDNKILKLPARVEAIKNLLSQLASFSDRAWWSADAVDLSVCDYTRQAGPLTPTERHDFLGGEYLFWLFGNERTRLVLVPDPCYQTQYGGANAFLLYRNEDRVARTGNRVPRDTDLVVVTQVLDGYFSRADNSVGVAFAKLGAEDVIEISTGSGGLNPTLTNYYFTIDPHSHRAIPKKLFLGEHGPMNEITSAMLLESAGPEPLKVFRGAMLAPRFIIYTDAQNGRIEDSGRTLTRKILRWTGTLYR